MTQKLVGSSILSASLFLEPWVITKVRNGEMSGVLSYGIHRANVAILYDVDRFRIIYKYSENFDYDPDDHSIHPNYNSWVKRLERSVNKEIQYRLQLLEE